MITLEVAHRVLFNDIIVFHIFQAFFLSLSLGDLYTICIKSDLGRKHLLEPTDQFLQSYLFTVEDVFEFNIDQFSKSLNNSVTAKDPKQPFEVILAHTSRLKALIDSLLFNLIIGTIIQLVDLRLKQ